MKNVIMKANEKNLKKIYEKVRPHMQKKLGRVLTYDEFVQHMAFARKEKLIK